MADAVQRLQARAVGEAHVLELDPPGEGRRHAGVIRLGDGGLQLEHLDDALQAGLALADLAALLGQVAHRRVHLVHVGGEHEQVARGQAPGPHAVHPEPDHRAGAEGGDELHRAGVGGLEPGHAQADLGHADDGTLVGFHSWRALEPGAAPGDPPGGRRDAEALAVVGDDLAIAYEGHHRLRRVPLAAPAAGATAVPVPAELAAPPEKQEAIAAELAAIFRTRTRDAWLAELAAHDCCCEPVLELDEVASHPLHQARGVFFTLPGEAGPVQQVRTPLGMPEGRGLPPRHGQVGVGRMGTWPQPQCRSGGLHGQVDVAVIQRIAAELNLQLGQVGGQRRQVPD